MVEFSYIYWSYICFVNQPQEERQCFKLPKSLENYRRYGMQIMISCICCIWGLIFWHRRELVSTILKRVLRHFNEDIVQIPQEEQEIPRTSPVLLCRYFLPSTYGSHAIACQLGKIIAENMASLWNSQGIESRESAFPQKGKGDSFHLKLKIYCTPEPSALGGALCNRKEFRGSFRFWSWDE